MQKSDTRRRGGFARIVRHTLSVATIAFAAACSDESSPSTGPIIPGDGNVPGTASAVAWRFDVNTSSRTVRITPPSAGLGASPNLSLSAGHGISYSLIGSDVITLSANNYIASGVGTGGAPAGKVLVKFDLAITNLLTSVDLITPTFPTPPAGVSGIFAFPFSTNVTTTSGGVQTGGNNIIIDLPNTGQVAPSSDFDGAPHNFFNDTGCPAGANDCFRHEVYAVPVPAGGTTSGQTIGFVIDPTVSNFSAKIIVAADLQNSGPAITRTVSGTVSSNIGPLSGGTVAVTGAGTASPSAGAYSIPGVGAGPHTVSYTPPAGSGCTTPASQAITVTSGSPSPIVVDFTVTGCTPPPVPSGTVNGLINFAAGTGSSPSLTGVVVTITPSAAGTSPATTNPNAAGSYSSASVAVGSGAGQGAGTVSFASLPAGCTFVGPSTATYTGLTVLGTVSATAVSITCPATPYPLTYSWSAPSGGQITLTASINMNAQNSLLNHGASPDLIGAFQSTITYGTAVSAPVCTGQTGFTGVFNTAGNSVTSVLTNLSGAGGTVTVFTCTFTHNPAGTTTLTGSGHLLSDETGADDFTARITVIYNTIPIS